MNLKYLLEQRSENQEKMQEILNGAKLEKRALTESEISKWNGLKKLIAEIDATINAEEESRKMDIEEKNKTVNESKKENEGTEKEADNSTEERAFVEFIVTG